MRKKSKSNLKVMRSSVAGKTKYDSPENGKSSEELSSAFEEEQSDKLNLAPTGRQSHSKIDSDHSDLGEPQSKKEKHANTSDACNDVDLDSIVDVTGLDSKSESDFVLSQLHGHHDEWTFSSNEDNNSVCLNSVACEEQSKSSSPDHTSLSSDITEAADLVPYIQQKLRQEFNQRVQENKVSDVSLSHNWLIDQMSSSKRRKKRSHYESIAEGTPVIRKSSHQFSEDVDSVIGRNEGTDKKNMKNKSKGNRLMETSEEGQKRKKEKNRIKEGKIQKETRHRKKKRIQGEDGKNLKQNSHEPMEYVINRDNDLTRKLYLEFLHSRGLSEELERLPNCSVIRCKCKTCCESVHLKERGARDKKNSLMPDVSQEEIIFKKKKRKRKMDLDSQLDSVARATEKEDTPQLSLLDNQTSQFKGKLKKKKADKTNPSVFESREKVSENESSHDIAFGVSGCEVNNTEPKKMEKQKRRHEKSERKEDNAVAVDVMHIDSSPEVKADAVSNGEKKKRKYKRNASVFKTGENVDGNESTHDTTFIVSDCRVNNTEPKTIEKQKNRHEKSERKEDSAAAVDVIHIESSPEIKADVVSNGEKKKRKDKKKASASGNVEKLNGNESTQYTAVKVSDCGVNNMEPKTVEKKKRRHEKSERKDDNAVAVDVIHFDSSPEIKADEVSNVKKKKKIRNSMKSMESLNILLNESINSTADNETKRIEEETNTGANHDKKAAVESKSSSQESEEAPLTCNSVDLFKESQEDLAFTDRRAHNIADKLPQKETKRKFKIPLDPMSAYSMADSSSLNEIPNTGGSSEQSVIEGTPETELNSDHNKVKLNHSTKNNNLPKVFQDSPSSLQLSSSPWHRLSRDSNGSFTQTTSYNTPDPILSLDKKVNSCGMGYVSQESQRSMSRRFLLKSQPLLNTSSSGGEENARTPTFLPTKFNQSSEPFELLSPEEKSSASSHHTASQKSTGTLGDDARVERDPNQSMPRHSSDSVIQQSNTFKSSNIRNAAISKGVTLKEIFANRIINTDSDSSSFDEEDETDFVPKKHKLLSVGDKKQSKSLIRVHKCTRCHQLFDNATQMMQHECKRMFHMRKVSHPEARFECDHCDRKYKNKFHLNHHIRTFHQGRRNYECKLCKMAFGEKQTLVVHMRTHSGAEPFGCTLCAARFKTRNNLHTHYRTNHYLVPEFFCEYCDNKAYYFARDLAEHKRTIHLKKKKTKKH
ncbi:Zinc finger protein 268 [Frankliniella fusca]|uniref:Zinc finger protein 268 n=1 Tax=Frankliniella fusca TaxID=407009 RepID=A0AAE1LM10_9NEOP|nr:Zinc finger protein 268 [Frankliniella fusca]